MRSQFILSFMILTLWPSSLLWACTGTTAVELQKKLEVEHVERLVFFASWCLSCKEHLRVDHAQTSYFLSVFDEQKAASQAFKALMGEVNVSRCLWDRDGSIAKFYKVRSLPASRLLKADKSD